MHELKSSDFIHIPTFAEYVMSLEPEQRVALNGFYRLFYNPPYGEPVSHLDGRPGNYPVTVGRVRSVDNTLFALNSTVTAHEDPADYLLTAAELREDTMMINELEIVRVRHASSVQNGSQIIDKIIDAKWHETSKHATIRLGRHALIITENQNGIVTQSPTLPIDWPTDI